MKHCPDCGTATKTEREGLCWSCPACQLDHYANPIPTADVLLFDEDGRVLLTVRAQEPYVGKLNSPGGFLDPHESLEDGAIRELREELGLNPSDYSPLRYVGSFSADHTEKGRTRDLTITMWMAKMPHREFEPNEEASEIVWINPSELAPDAVTRPQEYEMILRAAEMWRSNDT